MWAQNKLTLIALDESSKRTFCFTSMPNIVKNLVGGQGTWLAELRWKVTVCTSIHYPKSRVYPRELPPFCVTSMGFLSALILMYWNKDSMKLLTYPYALSMFLQITKTLSLHCVVIWFHFLNFLCLPRCLKHLTFL